MIHQFIINTIRIEAINKSQNLLCCSSSMLLQYIVVVYCCSILLQYVVVVCCCSILLQYVVVVCCCSMLLQYIVVECCCSMLLQYDIQTISSSTIQGQVSNFDLISSLISTQFKCYQTLKIRNDLMFGIQCIQCDLQHSN